MIKKIISIIFILAGGLAMVWWIQYSPILEKDIAMLEDLSNDIFNTSYLIKGETLTSIDGIIEKEIDARIESKIVINVIDSNTRGDLNDDGQEDTVVLLNYDGGGSRTFFYIAVALKIDTAYKGTNAILIGEHIDLPKIEIINKKIIVNYFEREKNEPITATPTIKVTREFFVENLELKETTSELSKNGRSLEDLLE